MSCQSPRAVKREVAWRRTRSRSTSIVAMIEWRARGGRGRQYSLRRTHTQKLLLQSFLSCRVPSQSRLRDRSPVAPLLPKGTTRAVRRESPDAVPLVRTVRTYGRRDPRPNTLARLRHGTAHASPRDRHAPCSARALQRRQVSASRRPTRSAAVRQPRAQQIHPAAPLGAERKRCQPARETNVRLGDARGSR